MEIEATCGFKILKQRFRTDVADDGWTNCPKTEESFDRKCLMKDIEFINQLNMAVLLVDAS